MRRSHPPKMVGDLPRCSIKSFLPVEFAGAARITSIASSTLSQPVHRAPLPLAKILRSTRSEGEHIHILHPLQVDISGRMYYMYPEEDRVVTYFSHGESTYEETKQDMQTRPEKSVRKVLINKYSTFKRKQQ
jgi:hypothetical protein